MKISQILNLNEERDLETEDNELKKINKKNKERDAEKAERSADAAKRRSDAYKKKVAKEGKKPLSAENRAKNDAAKAAKKKSDELYNNDKIKSNIKAGKKYDDQSDEDRDAAMKKRADYRNSPEGKEARSAAARSGGIARAQKQRKENSEHRKSAKKAHADSMEKIAKKSPQRARDIKKDQEDRDATTKLRANKKKERVTESEDLTSKSDNELALLVSNTKALYDIRHTPNLMSAVKAKYKYTPAQLAELKKDLASDKEELDDEK